MTGRKGEVTAVTPSVIRTLRREIFALDFCSLWGGGLGIYSTRGVIEMRCPHIEAIDQRQEETLAKRMTT